MICLKGNAARPINKQKKDELKNFLTNLRLKITKKYFQEDWKVKKLSVQVYCYYPLVVSILLVHGLNPLLEPVKKLTLITKSKFL